MRYTYLVLWYLSLLLLREHMVLDPHVSMVTHRLTCHFSGIPGDIFEPAYCHSEYVQSMKHKCSYAFLRKKTPALCPAQRHKRSVREILLTAAHQKFAVTLKAAAINSSPTTPFPSPTFTSPSMLYIYHLTLKIKQFAVPTSHISDTTIST